MSFQIDSGVAALIGALLGSLPPLIMYISERKAARRKQLMDVALAMSIKNYEENNSFAKMMWEKAKTSVTVPSIETYFHYHYKLQLMPEDDGSISPEQWKKLRKQQHELQELIKQHQPKENSWANKTR